MAECLSKDQQVLVLVPEIALTPQTIARFKARFEASIVVFHSGLTDQQRLQAWLDCSSGRAHIAIGTRSALFVPMRRPGLIVIDEEHDGSFKQQDGFRYSARDLAVVRAQIEDIPLILGSATPSLESYHNALTGKYQHIRLTHRAGGASKEKYEIWTLPTPHLDRATQSRMTALIESSLGAGGQVLVMINRRGFAPVLFCTECHWIAECEHCDSRMTLHRLDQSSFVITARQASCLRCNALAVATAPSARSVREHKELRRRSAQNFPIIPFIDWMATALAHKARSSRCRMRFTQASPASSLGPS